MTGFKPALALSAAAHAAALAFLLLLPPTPVAEPPAAELHGIEVAVVQALPKPEPLPPPPVEAPVSPPPARIEPAPPEPPPVAEPTPPPSVAPPPPAPEAAVEVPPPPRKPPVPHAVRPAARRAEPRPEAPPLPAPAVPQTAYAPPPLPAPAPPAAAISPDYRALLAAWLDRHKRYPQQARERGEEGRAVLRFAVERDGRVADYAIVQSTGHPDLDAAIAEMMRGAVLPPFPADMPQPRIEVSVTIRFSLAR